MDSHLGVNPMFWPFRDNPRVCHLGRSVNCQYLVQLTWAARESVEQPYRPQSAALEEGGIHTAIESLMMVDSLKESTVHRHW